MPTIFERIVAGEIPCHKIWENATHMAFLDVNPRVEGHTLVIPKVAHEELFSMDEDAYLELWKAARTVARHLKKETGCKRVITTVVGYEVPHVHVHLLPTNSLSEFPFPPVNREARSRLAETAEQLRIQEG
ncbi:MAG TPA: HIT family protein [Acidobacteria bacterium]|nr:HIT family protein [Acidobacteriota bacterium]